jgi:glycosyltransferase involved in cell wall biosynthesis
MTVVPLQQAVARDDARPEPRSQQANWPRITLVTAVYNGAEYLEATIESVLRQNYPNLEHIVVDDGSTDETPQIIAKYASHWAWQTRHSNRGLYRSLNVGFERATGEIMGWLNASDMLHVNSLFAVGSVFARFPEVEWITGRPTIFSPDGMPVGAASSLPRWCRYPFLLGQNKAIQQESTFWRSRLWQKAGGRMETAYRAEGDFELWVRFFRHARLYPVDALIGGYRRHANSLSSSNIQRYNQTCDGIVDKELDRVRGGRFIRLFARADRLLKPIPLIGSIWYWITLKVLYPLTSPERPPVIRYGEGGWTMDDQGT